MPAVVALNAALASVAWFLLPPSVQAWLFSLHGPLAFPIVLAAWMVSDSPATNVLADQAVDEAVLTDCASTRRWIVARSIALGSLVGVPCIVVALLLGAVHGQWSQVALTCAAIVVAPLGILPLAACLGLLLPYRPRPLARRWQQRRAWRTQVRWALLVLAPYVVVPMIGSVLVLPALVVELTVAGRSSSLSPSEVVLVASTLTVTMLVAGLAGLEVASAIAGRRRRRLLAFLVDP